jgi:DNA-binding NarL/FixJ family response regulator
MYDSDQLLIRLLQAGVKGFLKKDIHPSELKFAILSVMQVGYYYSHHTSHKLASLFRKKPGEIFSYESSLLSDIEIDFLRLACTEKTYKEIALELKLNPRSVDGLRDSLFEKLDVKSRVGLALFAIKKGIVAL